MTKTNITPAAVTPDDIARESAAIHDAARVQTLCHRCRYAVRTPGGIARCNRPDDGTPVLVRQYGQAVRAIVDAVCPWYEEKRKRRRHIDVS